MSHEDATTLLYRFYITGPVFFFLLAWAIFGNIGGSGFPYFADVVYQYFCGGELTGVEIATKAFQILL